MTDSLSPSALALPLSSSSAMRAILDTSAMLQRMLDFEAALARAEAAVGIIPANAAGDIANACRADRYDVAALTEAAGAGGHIAPPLIAALTAEVEKRNPDSAKHVHWGASIDDLIDTALVLELRAAIDALIADLDRAVKAFTTLAGKHRRTITLAPGGAQQNVPVPFGIKIATFATALGRSRERLRRLRREALVLQFGGAGGTLAALGEQGIEVANRLAALLDLSNPEAPWHSHRDRLADVAAALAILATSCGRVASEIATLMQREIGDIVERSSRSGNGSSGASNRRPSLAISAAQSAAAMAPGLTSTILAAHGQERCRDIEGAMFPVLLSVASAAVQTMIDIAEGIDVDAERIKSRLEASGVAANALGSAQTFLDRLVAASFSRSSRRADPEPRPIDPKTAAPTIAPEPSQQPPTPPAEPAAPPASALEPPALEAQPVAASSEAAPKPEPNAELGAATPAQEQPGALIEAFARIAEATDRLAQKPPDDDNKPA